MARSRARALLIPLWMSSGSMIWRPMVSTGLSEVIGSWKIIADVAAADARASLVGDFEQVAALEQDAPVDDAAGAAWRSRRMIASDDTDLPQPDSPTIATISPRRTS